MGHHRLSLKKKKKSKLDVTRFFLFSLFLLIGAVALSAFFTLYTNEQVHYYDRESGLMQDEIVPGKYWIRWLYNDPVGRMSLQAAVSRKFVSDWYGGMMDKPSSVKRIPGFIEELEIDMTPFLRKTDQYVSFNDFFTRRVDPKYRPIAKGPNVVVSPADSKVLGFENLSTDREFPIKGFDYNLASLLDDPTLAARYENGSMLIFRLTPADYHRFHFPVAGVPGETKKIEGRYYSVSPLALRKKLRAFSENKREYCMIENSRFGDIVMMEIGSTLTGGIRQEYQAGEPVLKGSEKGCFYFGGSTVILLFEPGKIRIDADILKRSGIRIETSVRMGQRVAGSK